VAYAYNVSYSGGRDWEDQSLEPVGQKIMRLPSPSQPIAGHSGACLSLQLCRKHKQEDRTPGCLGQKARSYPQNN
jgi:hypothetical protein